MKVKELILSNAFTALRRDDGNLRPGEIVLANEARFTEQYYSEPLTAFGIGFRDPANIEEELEFVAPAVLTGRRFEFKKAANAEEFYSETDDERSIGSDFKRVAYTGESVTDKTINKGLTFRADLDQYADQPNWREVITGRLIRRIWRNDLRRAKTLLAAAANNTAKTWDTTALKDPDMDVLNDLIAAANVSGIRPNRILFGETAWSKRLLSLRAQNLKGQANSSTMTPAELAGWFGVDEVRVSKTRYASTATAKTEIVANLVMMFFAEAGQSPDESSNIKRFVSVVEGGGKLRVYEQQVSAKLVDITVEHYSNSVITASGNSIRKLTIS
jgi:hypothetical protein